MYNDEIFKKLHEIRELMIKECGNEVTNINIKIDIDGVNIKTFYQSAANLKKRGITMRNINGDFIN